MCKRNTDIENEKKLFHGSSHESIEAINKTGFNRRYCGKNGKTCDFSYTEKR